MSAASTRWIGIVLGCLCLAACGDPEQEFRVKVVNEDGKPMAGVDCQAGFYRASQSGTGPRSYPVKGRTDASGQVELRGETCFFNSAVRARSEGHYDCLVDKLWITGRSANRWEPWPVEVELIMKKIRNPHPMYAVGCDANFWFEMPGQKLGRYGFDLLRMDWVAPHGKGEVSDFILEGRLLNPNDQEYRPKGVVNLTFSHPGDGIQHIPGVADGGSLFTGPAEAPAEGYLDHWDFQTMSEPRRAPAGRILGPSVYAFRIRTALDENKEVASAIYGKLIHPVQASLYYKNPTVRMVYLVNRAPNDRNLEWDMEHNLFPDLDRTRWPERP